MAAHSGFRLKTGHHTLDLLSAGFLCHGVALLEQRSLFRQDGQAGRNMLEVLLQRRTQSEGL